MKASDLYFHVLLDFENMEDVMICITPINFWETNHYMSDSFYVTPNTALAKEFESAGLNVSETMEGVYELNYDASIDDVLDVIERLESVGFRRNKEFSDFLTNKNRTNYIDGDVIDDDIIIEHVKTVTKPTTTVKTLLPISTLQKELIAAVKAENYEYAAKLRDEINLRKK